MVQMHAIASWCGVVGEAFGTIRVKSETCRNCTRGRLCDAVGPRGSWEPVKICHTMRRRREKLELHCGTLLPHACTAAEDLPPKTSPSASRSPTKDLPPKTCNATASHERNQLEMHFAKPFLFLKHTFLSNLDNPLI